jgi:hypothetical protein
MEKRFRESAALYRDAIAMADPSAPKVSLPSSPRENDIRRLEVRAKDVMRAPH